MNKFTRTQGSPTSPSCYLPYAPKGVHSKAFKELFGLPSGVISPLVSSRARDPLVSGVLRGRALQPFPLCGACVPLAIPGMD